jgi:hypothetical protein
MQRVLRPYDLIIPQLLPSFVSVVIPFVTVFR